MKHPKEAILVLTLMASSFPIIAWESGEFESQPPPMPGPAFVAPPPALRLATQVDLCSPVLADETRVHAFEWCDRLGGFVSHGWAFLECWTEQGRAHEEGYLLFRLEANGAE